MMKKYELIEMLDKYKGEPNVFIVADDVIYRNIDKVSIVTNIDEFDSNTMLIFVNKDEK